EDYVDVHALKQTKKDRDELDLVSIEVTVNGTMRIETVQSRRSEDDSFFGRVFGKIYRKWPKVSVEYTIKLPKSSILARVSTVNGNVELHGTRGGTSVHTTNGKISVRETEGYVDAKITNGSISITDGATVRSAKSTNGNITATISEELAENVDISTVNGSVDLYLPSDINADVDLKTVNGGISAGGLRMIVDSISKRHFTGTLGSGGKTINVSTVNGSVSLHKE
ncbi:unnamed protein product, partial [marine sediment metagenome]